MVKKVKTVSKQDKNLSDNIRESAQQIWLAGMGAFSRAQEGGNKVFENLMKEGHALQARTRQVAERQVEEMAAKATGAWDKLETVFEHRVERSLNSLGVPTHQDISRLSDRVDALAALVEGRKAPRAAAAPQKAPAKAAKPVAKPAAKKAAKPVAKKAAKAPAAAAA